MKFFTRKQKCQKFFTYETRKINLKGLTANLPTDKAGGLNIGVGEISIDPEYVEASDRLQELDLIQYSICLDLNKLDNGNPAKNDLIMQIVQTKIEMLKIAQNPEALKKKEITPKQ